MKFLNLPKEQQHRLLADLLRESYPQPPAPEYSLLRSLIGLSPFPLTDPKKLADEYHTHLSQAGRSLKEHNLLPQKDTLHPKLPSLPVHIYLENIRSAHNVGSIIRTAEAFALGTLYFSAKTPPITHKQVKDAAMGADAWVEASSAPPPKPLIALETTGTSLYDFRFPPAFTLALGNEEYGCSDELLASADAIISIPLAGRKNSLNVANAFAIAAAEIRRQLA